MIEKNVDYESLIEWLFNQFPVFQKVGESAYKPTLDNTSALIEHFNVDLEKLKFVHVAGTNGKGTTASIIASTLTETGLKTGLFTSPHIQDFRERIRVDGKMISEEAVSQFINAVKDQPFSFTPSFFELSWVMALLHFQREKCNMVVVETGLGGRLDATNVITPLISVITNIGLDHMSILGDSLGQIAREKAGIIKSYVPVVIGQSQAETSDIFNEVAKTNNSKIHFVGQSAESSTFEMNKKTAEKALKLLNHPTFRFDPEIFEKGLQHLSQNTGLVGRFQKISDDPVIIIDGAHNRDGVQRLIKDVNRFFSDRQVYAIYGASNDKEVDQLLRFVPDEWRFNFTEFKNKRSCTIKELKEQTKNFSFQKKYFESPREAFNEVQSIINKEDVIVVFGSFFLLEEII